MEREERRRDGKGDGIGKKDIKCFVFAHFLQCRKKHK